MPCSRSSSVSPTHNIGIRPDLRAAANLRAVNASSSAYRAWAELLSAEFSEHLARVEQGELTTLDPYGAENRAEFFAVATETFFEKPVQLRKALPDLYALLVGFFKIDPERPDRSIENRGAD